MLPRRPLTANDNARSAKPTQPLSSDVCRAAAQARRIGNVIASDADEAIRAAAVEFKTDIKKLIALRRYEVAPA